MEASNSYNNIKNNKTLDTTDKRSSRKEIKKQSEFIKYIKINSYLNEYNYFFKNAIKMNKLRKEKYQENKMKKEIARKNNILPKMLYFNKYLNNSSKKFPKNNNININPIKNAEIKNLLNNNIEIASSESRPCIYENIEKAIFAKKMEENNKSHIKKTIKIFDDLIQYVDNFQLPEKKKKINFKINDNNDRNSSLDINKEETSRNSNYIGEEDDLKVEKYDYDEYKELFKSKNQLRINTIPKNQLTVCSSDRELLCNFSEDHKNLKNLYLTASNNINRYKNNNSMKVNGLKKKLYSNDSKKFKEKNKKQERKKLIINGMALISDDLLFNKIKNLTRDFRKGLYFDEYGKYKYTELGLNYPNSVDKFKKIPDFKGDDKEERRVFNYRSKVTNARHNYTNIGTFSEKFNNDLSDISTFYGKQSSKGRFLMNPLVSKYTKYIPNYEQYKDLKFIENKYNSKNKYKFRLKPLVDNKKNNFDKLADIVYQKEHKREYFSNS